jgi:uncharacterized protein involved in outer membrane biogenesis
MMRIRLVVSCILAIVTVALGALAVFPPKEFVKSRLVQGVKAATGRELAVKGATSLRLLPTFVLRVENVELKNPPGASGDPLFAAHAVLIESDLWPLLIGSNAIDRIDLEGPRISLATSAEGQSNWTMPPGGGLALVVRTLTFAGGVLTYRNGSSNEVLSVKGADGIAREIVGANIAQLELTAGEANIRTVAAGPLLTFAAVDAEAKAIAAGNAGEVTLNAASLLYRQGDGSTPIKLEAPQVTAKSVSPAGVLDVVVAEVLKKGADKGALSPQLTETLEALKTRAEGSK